MTGFYLKKRVLVTGAGGFIGSHLVEALDREGAHVRALLRYSSRADAGNLDFASAAAQKNLEIIRGDVRDPHMMLRACEGVDVVFHLAALIGIPHSYHAPSEYVATNVVGTLNMLEAARSQQVKRFIHTSTSETYGTAQYTPIDEKHPLVGQSPYSASKVGADKLAESYYCSFDFPVVTVRPFNTYGPRQSARAIVPVILSQLMAKTDRLRLGSLEPERDFTYVSDTVGGILALGACDLALGKTVNLGSGSTFRIGDIANRCMKLVGREVPFETDPRRVRPQHSEVGILVSDNRLAKKLCGWEPEVSLDEGLQQCSEFIRDHPQFFHPEEYQR
jgi:NAD dependent epimerase/dehydratase